MILYDNKRENRAKIEYPCEWGFKVIGTDRKRLKNCIADIMAHKDYIFKDGNISSRGKFISMNARCIVSSEEERNEIFKAFQEHCDIKMVI